MTDAQYHRRLQSIHAQAESLLVSVETLMADGAEPAQTPNGCPHPPEKRETITTLSDKAAKYRCRACGQEYT